MSVSITIDPMVCVYVIIGAIIFNLFIFVAIPISNMMFEKSLRNMILKNENEDCEKITYGHNIWINMMSCAAYSMLCLGIMINPDYGVVGAILAGIVCILNIFVQKFALR
ncbi:MAG: hypothetical protein ACKOPQ_04050 [Novosphingobium sp.]